jgi:hypothetical protein
MTKTKKLYLFAATFLFLNVFFLRIDSLYNDAKAFDCYDLCAGEADPDTCFAECQGSSNYTNSPSISETVSCPTGYHVDSLGQDCISDTKTDCSDYQNTHAVNGSCICDNGYDRNADGGCSIGKGGACTDNYDTSECCVANRGYWYNSMCNTDPNTGTVGNSCSSDFDCNDGYKCDSSGTCMVDSFFSATECKTDGDCEAGYGAGFVCSGFIVKTCEKSTSASKTNPIAELKNAITLKNGSVAPMGTIVNSDGSGTSPSGQTYPAGSFQPPSGGISNDNYSPFVLGSNYGSGGTNTPKCGANFQDIGGVCFPTNTGLSNAPIYVILSNIFSWLMGLFTTFAVLAFVIAGVQYLLASGDESMAKSAKTNAVYAIIGIIVGLSGFIIIKAIAAALSGQSILF